MPVACPSCGTRNPDQARYCFACATPLSPGRFERKFATALFADIVGSTALGEREDPEVVRRVVGGTLERIAEIARRHGGTVEKFMGDGILVVFGIPTSHEDDPERAVRAALEIQREMAAGGPGMAVRIGIEAGEVLADVEAAAGPRERMLTGDAVNIAARLQGEAEPGGVVVGPNVYEATKAVVTFRELGLRALKGKSAPVTAWQAMRAPPPRRDRPGPSVRTRLIGRDEQLARLHQVLEEVRSTGTPRVMALFGVAGVGKSRLAEEFLERLRPERAPLRVLKGQCLSYGNVAYSALADALRRECGILDDDAPPVAAERIARMFGPYVEDPSLLQKVNVLLGLAHEQFGRQELFDAWRRLLEGYVTSSPLLLMLEDLQWSDDGLLDFVEHLAGWARGSIAVLTLARPELLERRPAWARYATVHLDPLAPEEIGAMLDELVSARLPDALRRVVIQRSEGNPLFGEEIVRMLIDQGTIRRDSDGRWIPRDDAVSVTIPRSIQALIAARLDALPPEEKLLVQDAAVIGRSFWLGAVERISGRPSRAIAPALMELERKEIFSPPRPSALSGETERSFRHVLIRDVAYESIPKSLRLGKNLDVARWIESRVGERSEEVAERLAAHYLESLGYLDELGGRNDLQPELERGAYRWALVAGERAVRMWQQGEAIRWLETALELHGRASAPDQERARLLEWYAHSLEGARPYGDVAAALERALSLYERIGDETSAGRVEAWLAYVAFQSAQDEAVLPAATRALTRLELMGESLDLALALTILGWYHRRRARFAEAEPPLRRAMEMAERLGDPIAEARAMGSLGKLLQQSGRVDEGVALLEKAYVIAGSAGDLSVLLRAIIDLSEAHEEATGDYARAEALVREGLESARRVGSVQQIAWMQGNLADYLVDMGRLDEAEPVALSGLEAARASGEIPRVGLSLDCVASLHVMRGRIDRAEEALRELHPLLLASPEPYLEGWVPLIGAWIARARGNETEATEILRRGAERLGRRVEVWGGQNLLLEGIRMLVRDGRREDAIALHAHLRALAETRVPPRAFLAWAEGLLQTDLRKAKDALTDAVGRFRELGRRIEEGRCLGDLATVERALGGEARPTLEQARRILESTGAVFFLRDLPEE